MQQKFNWNFAGFTLEESSGPQQGLLEPERVVHSPQCARQTFEQRRIERFETMQFLEQIGGDQRGLLEAESQGRVAETLPELCPDDLGLHHIDLGQEFAPVPTERRLEIQTLERPQKVPHIGVEVAQFVDAIPTVDAGSIAKFFAQSFEGHAEVDLERIGWFALMYDSSRLQLEEFFQIGGCFLALQDSGFEFFKCHARV